MPTLQLVVSEGKRLSHDWIPNPCHCDGGGCMTCNLDLATCSACGLDSHATHTTHCPGKRVMPEGGGYGAWSMLMAVMRAGLDYENGAWVWCKEESVIMTGTGERRVTRRAGSINHLVQYAENRLVETAGRRRPW